MYQKKVKQPRPVNFVLALLVLSMLGSACSKPNPTFQPNNSANTNANVVQTKPSSTLVQVLSPTPTKPEPDSNAIAAERSKKGEAIYRRTSARLGLPIIFGWRGSNITIPITNSDWKGLSKEQQIDLTYYVEHLLEEIKGDPVPFVTRWSSYYKRTEHLEAGGEYDGLYMTSYFDQVRRLCSICWSITIGKAKRDGFYDESTPVSGSTVQDFRAGIK